MELSADNNAVLIGLYTMRTRNGIPYYLDIDANMLRSLGLDDKMNAEQVFVQWSSLIGEEDFPAILHAVHSCIGGLQAEVHFKWQHPVRGITFVSCTGVLSNNDGTNAEIKGFFKLMPIDANDPAEDSKDRILSKLMLMDVLMDSFAMCALADVKTNSIYFLRDSLAPELHTGSITFDEWRESFLPMVFTDDADKFRRICARALMPDYFDRFGGEFQTEIRFHKADSGEYRRIRLRFVRFDKTIAGRFTEAIFATEINSESGENFRELLRRRLLNGLALPYNTLDLINLKTGVFYSSTSRQGEFTENIEEMGSFDDAFADYLSNCELTEKERDRLKDLFCTKSLARRFGDGEKLLECEIRHRREQDGVYEWVRLQAFQSTADEERRPYMAILTIMRIDDEKEQQLRAKRRLEMALRNEKQYKRAMLSAALAVYFFNVSSDTIIEEYLEDDKEKPLLPLMEMSVPCSYDEYIAKKSTYFIKENEAEFFRTHFNRDALLEMYENQKYTVDYDYQFGILNRTGYFRETVILTKDLVTNEIWGLNIVRNVTAEYNERSELEQALREAYMHATNANASKTAFMSQMSHDIRTPLNVILGKAALAREHIDDRRYVSDCMDSIDRAGRHLLELVNNVLDISAIESGKHVLAEESFALGAFLRETIAIVKPLSDERKHNLTVEIQPMNEQVVGDPAKLRQILMNVLSNAIKYTPEGGQIRFLARELEPERHDVCRYFFTVEDNGIGMSKAFLERIFDPFARAENNPLDHAQSTGLGMTVARNTARMMNGDILVFSEEGKGSRFEITVCLKRGEEQRGREFDHLEQKKVRLSDYDFAGKRVLLAEDLKFNADIAAEFLNEAGVSAELAENGAEAVKLFSESKIGFYDLIFMDIQMPVMDGYAATAAIRELPRADAKTVPIVAMTANAFIEDIRKAEECGMNGHIAKPLEIPVLVGTLVKYFGDKKRKAD